MQAPGRVGGLPSGTVTFLFTDVEGSTRLLNELGPERYAEVLAEHRRILRAAFGAYGGVEVDTQGDAFFVAFPTAPGALNAAETARGGLEAGPIRVRMGVHTGTPHVSDEGYVGVDVHRAARIAAAGHGGQLLVSAATASLVQPGDTFSLRDLGEHRLKDLSAPERIFQLGEGDFPPLKSLYRTNLPVPATPFLGRRQELGRVVELLAHARLLTLTGPGGTGKTRLALQAAAEASEHYPDGVFWVPLAPLRDPALVLEEAAQAIAAKDGLAEHVADKSLLLLLDNFEHVVDAATDLSGLLAACPNLHVLVTSRELLRVPAEQAYPVPPLEPEDGTELFLARARAVEPGFTADETVSELCARLDNLPLALELAAARVRVLSPDRLLERLSQRLDLLKAGRGADPRQQTLRATIEWSHDLLAADEQRLFARLAVFAGGCTLEAAETVCDADVDVLQSLVDKSLVRVRDGDRFWMLGTIRDYALERLEASGEADELGRRHAAYFLALAQEAEPSVLGVDPAEWLDRLERDHGNLRAALDWLEAAGEPQLALMLGGTLWEFWCLRSHYGEGWRRLERLLALDDGPTLARAKALTGAGHLAQSTAEGSSVSRRRREEALALHRRVGGAWDVAFAEFEFAASFAAEGDFAAARPLVAESRERLREVGDEHRVLQATRMLAWCNLELGETERAAELYRELLEGARAAGDRHLEARALGQFALTASDEGRHGEALDLLAESYRIDCEHGDPSEIAIDMIRFGRALALAGRANDAVTLLSLAEAKAEELAMVIPDYVLAYRDEADASARAHLDAAAFAAAWERGRGLTPDEGVALALGS